MKKWHGYDLHQGLVAAESLYLNVYSECLLPKKIPGKCSLCYSQTINAINVGATADIALGDPVVLLKAKLIVRDLAKLPNEFYQRIPKNFWENHAYNRRGWQVWLWQDNLVLVNYQNIALAKKIIKHFWWKKTFYPKIFNQ